MTNEKHFSKTISQWEFDSGLFTNLPRIINACDFVHSNSKEVSYLSWQNKYLNLKSIKLKLFLWTELQESLLLAIYLISVDATLGNIGNNIDLLLANYENFFLFEDLNVEGHNSFLKEFCDVYNLNKSNQSSYLF